MTHRGRFHRGDRRTREAGRKGGLVRAAQTRREQGPYTGSILQAMDSAGLTGESWAAWRAFLKAVFSLPMNATELRCFRQHTERESPPAEPVREAWMPVGRRGGKSRIAALVALFLAIRFDP